MSYRQLHDLDQLKAGLHVPESTLHRWRKGLKEDTNCFDEPQIPGRPRALTKEHEALMTGFILSKNALNVQVTFDDILTFLKDQLGVSTSLSTVYTYCRANGFSQLCAKVRSASTAAISAHHLVEVVLAFIADLEKLNFYSLKPCNVLSVDFTMTSWGKRKVKTLGPTGAYVCLFSTVFFV